MQAVRRDDDIARSREHTRWPFGFLDREYGGIIGGIDDVAEGLGALQAQGERRAQDQTELLARFHRGIGKHRHADLDLCLPRGDLHGCAGTLVVGTRDRSQILGGKGETGCDRRRA